ncbi:DUF805 domain-containing protein [Rathayibacter sp. KR2-224]|uniref:DUF805 domain-containing protein n=1 Tax=Rathayibacter sp. KR2-224 TaxID=3400913 RepID=UPI003BFF3C1D
MNMGQAIATVFRKYADFTGRASRPEFWWFILFSTLVSAALSSMNAVTPWGVVQTGSSLAGVWSIAVLVPTLAVSVRRLRDAGRSWAELFWLLLPIAGLIVLIVHLCDAPAAERQRPAAQSGHPAPQA